jgi:hypothetical protein
MLNAGFSVSDAPVARDVPNRAGCFIGGIGTGQADIAQGVVVQSPQMGPLAAQVKQGQQAAQDGRAGGGGAGQGDAAKQGRHARVPFIHSVF